MILVMAGTVDGRTIADGLSGRGLSVLVTTVSQYGGELAGQGKEKEVLVQALTKEELMGLIRDKGIRLLVDGTHPYASRVSQNAMEACAEAAIPYLRYERPLTEIPQDEGILLVEGEEAACEAAAALGDVVFLTTGSNKLDVFTGHRALQGKRLIARVLPDPKVLARCFELGLRPKDIIAMQGPFSYEMNRAMFADTGCGVIITKDSGTIGGADAKIKAARDLGLPVVVIRRPPVAYGPMVHSPEEAVRRVIEMMEEME